MHFYWQPLWAMPMGDWDSLWKILEAIDVLDNEIVWYCQK
jgi:hypothetical protein